jgi:hypothetical protein
MAASAIINCGSVTALLMNIDLIDLDLQLIDL